MKDLRRGIDVVEVKGLLASTVATNHTTTASLLDKRLLDDPASLRHSLSPTAHAAVVPAALQNELGAPVSAAR
jgi:hypothetical protein